MARPIVETNVQVPNILLVPNTPVAPLLAGETYIGPWIECYQWNSLIVSMKTDVDASSK